MKTYRLNKEIVLECAMDLVAESGIDGLRLNKIADRLQVKSPSLYTHTGSVTELRSTVVCQAMNQFREQLVDSLMGRSQLHAFIELGKTWASYAKNQQSFYRVFYQPDYQLLYQENISAFLKAAFKRIFFDFKFDEKGIQQIERVLTNYFRGHTEQFNDNSLTEADLISDLEIIYTGLIKNMKEVSQVV
ncbi:TetR/AcrR family transcriptional regulator [Enterococcus hermanniensis]|uniref:HTH tetR-type domain-containing protein n=1 Tax=Enterococcus hermanniensis TaxID=249189 RepID=A0A1L8TNH7_9ENTE|nr:TetR family transcriptional regulator [Enterococcus hermanniensis]OJG45875.1 hypothetical protein RV04_GL001641 [Enterococcus hermanniensis]